MIKLSSIYLNIRIMEKIPFILLATLLYPFCVSGQPITSNNDFSEYWKGPVFSVIDVRAEYKENFGERILTNVDDIRVLVFDSKKRIILNRHLSSDIVESTIYLYDDNSSPLQMREIMLSSRSHKKPSQTLISQIKDISTTDFERNLVNNATKSETTHEYTFNKNGILLKHDILKNRQLMGRFEQKWNPIKGAYEFKNYGESGNLLNSGYCYYSGKSLTKADIQPYYETGITETYYYNSRGFITKKYDHDKKTYYQKGLYKINPTNGFDEDILLGKNIKYDKYGNLKSYQSEWEPSIWHDYNIEYITVPTSLAKKSQSLLDSLKDTLKL